MEKDNILKGKSLTSFKLEKGLRGEIKVPGDKSVSHRSVMLSSQAIGTSVISGLLESEDVLSTISALRKLGVNIKKRPEGLWEVEGVGVGGFKDPGDILDMGNAGTGARLMMGLLATSPFVSFFTGDASLRKRPMLRILKPLSLMGVQSFSAEGGRLPVAIVGNSNAVPIEYELPVASAQLKSAVLLAGLNCKGSTSVIEKFPSRDHTEKMLAGLGANIDISERDGKKYIVLEGNPKLKPMDISVPGDPSSASFLVAAALITDNSDVLVKNVCINPLRAGFYETLFEMNANIEFENERIIAGEKVADIRAKTSKNMKGVKVPDSRVPTMIDEYPILSIVACFASGETFMGNVGELRVKESDRIAVMEEGLKSCSGNIETGEDYIIVRGQEKIKGGVTVNTSMDHRVAMSFLVLGMASEEPVSIDSDWSIATSFPNFLDLSLSLGSKIS